MSAPSGRWPAPLRGPVPDDMTVARVHGEGDLRVAREPVAGPQPGESLVRVAAVGICGSDLHWYGEAGIGDARLERPLVLGHESAGVIVGGPRDGERVAIDPAIPCGRCEVCREGRQNLCPTVVFSGHGQQDGALREYLCWPTHLLHAVPDTLSADEVAMLEPLGVALHAYDLGHVRPAATVAVIGAGPIGLCMVQLARAAGAGRVLAADPLPHRAAAAARLGADVLLPSGPDEFAGAVEAATAGRRADVVLEAAGTDAAVALAVEAARPGARVVLAGIPTDDRITLPAGATRRKGLSVLLVRRMNEVYPRTIRLVERGLIDVGSLVSHTFPLADATAALSFAATRAGLKVLIVPG